jgi:hypothetical protein
VRVRAWYKYVVWASGSVQPSDGLLCRLSAVAKRPRCRVSMSQYETHSHVAVATSLTSPLFHAARMERSPKKSLSPARGPRGHQCLRSVGDRQP